MMGSYYEHGADWAINEGEIIMYWMESMGLDSG